jgi:hypothetical protein
MLMAVPGRRHTGIMNVATTVLIGIMNAATTVVIGIMIMRGSITATGSK